MRVMPFPFDLTMRPVKFVSGVKQQGLLGVFPESPPYQETGGEGGTAKVKAIALDSGRVFDGVAAGASGLGYTVLTKGLICFGTPRDGAGCFMAAPTYDYSAFQEEIKIKRGSVASDGELQWQDVDVGGGPGGDLIALTFAGGAFHAVFCAELGFGPTRVTTSFDGHTWQMQENVFPVGTDDEDGSEAITGGAVAFNGDTKKKKGTYAAAGQREVLNPDEEPGWAEHNSVFNLTWSTAAKPLPDESVLTWQYGGADEPDPRDETGAETGSRAMFNQQATIAGGKGIFVAATFKKEILVVDFGGNSRQIAVKTAAVASSPDGETWSNHVLTGVQEGMREPSVESSKDKSGDSKTLAVVFVQGNDEKGGYFLCATENFYHDQAAIATRHRLGHRA